MPKSVSFSMTLRVLGYSEDGEWAAHCLETDLVGRGATFKAAVADLRDLTEMQISFAVHQGQPALLDHPAPAHILETYMRIAEDYLRNFPKPPADPKRAVGSIPFPEQLGTPGDYAWARG